MRLAEGSFLRLERGSLKLVGCTKFTTCGSSRKRLFACFALVCLPRSLMSNWVSPSDRDLTTRKETRQRAWEVDGWAETVLKVRGPDYPGSTESLTPTNTDLPARKIDGRLYLDTAPLVSVEVDNRRTIPISVASSHCVPIAAPSEVAQSIRPKREPMRTECVMIFAVK